MFHMKPFPDAVFQLQMLRMIDGISNAQLLQCVDRRGLSIFARRMLGISVPPLPTAPDDGDPHFIPHRIGF